MVQLLTGGKYFSARHLHNIMLRACRHARVVKLLRLQASQHTAVLCMLFICATARRNIRSGKTLCDFVLVRNTNYFRCRFIKCHPSTNHTRQLAWSSTCRGMIGTIPQILVLQPGPLLQREMSNWRDENGTCLRIITFPMSQPRFALLKPATSLSSYTLRRKKSSLEMLSGESFKRIAISTG